MSEKQKSEAELKLELLASQKRIEAMLAEARSYKRKPAKVWAIVLLMTGIYAVYGFEVYSSPHPWRKLLPALVAGVLVLVFYGVGFLADRRKAKAKADWNRELDAAVDLKDFEDSYCLYYNLKPDQRQRLMNELKKMPRGSRSLLKAVRIVCPDLIDED